MKKVIYFLEFILVKLFFIICKLFGYRISSNLGFFIGKTFGNIGVHKLQPLVLVNYGGGNGNAIKELAFDIQASVSQKFGIELHPEVNII